MQKPIRPAIRLQYLNSVDQGRQLEFFSEIGGIGYSLATIVADETDESLWLEVFVNHTSVQIPLTLVKAALEAAIDQVHSEAWYERHVYNKNEPS